MVVAGCQNGFFLGDDDSDIPARTWIGTLWDYGITQGSMTLDDLNGLTAELRLADFTTQAFETAATLDTRWEPMLDLWNEGIDTGIAAWRKGGTDLDAIGKLWPIADRLTARCRVPHADATALADTQGVDLYTWVVEHDGGLLPLDLLLPAR